MKLEIIKDIVLANPIVSLPHWNFLKGQVLETENKYLSNRLVEIKAAKSFKEKSKKKEEAEISKDGAHEDDNSETIKKMMKSKLRDKSMKAPKNKSID